MVFRKLIGDLVKTSSSGSCDFFCDSDKNKDGVCPASCLHVKGCEKICRTVWFTIPKPPNQFKDNPYDDHSNKSHKYHLSLTIFVSILVSTFLLFLCLTIYMLYKRWNSTRRRRSRREDDDAEEEEVERHDDFINEDHEPILDHPIWYIRTVGLDPSVINSIAVCRFKKSEGLVEGTECSVCLNEFQEDENLRLLPKCSHAFHMPCIDTWLMSHTNCPVCRAPILSSGASDLPSPEQHVVDDSGQVLEPPQVEISENLTEVGRDREGEAFEIGINMEGSQSQIENEIKDSHDFQPMRRSVSLDCLSAAAISSAITAVHPGGQSHEHSSGRFLKENRLKANSVSKRVSGNLSLLRLVGSSSIGRSIQRGHTSFRRSFSFSSRALQSRHRHRHSQSSVLPL